MYRLDRLIRDLTDRELDQVDDFCVNRLLPADHAAILRRLAFL